MTMTATASRAFGPNDKRRFLRLLAQGQPRPAAAERVGFAWSTVRRHMKEDPDFGTAVLDAEAEITDMIEGKLVKLALGENLGAIQYWLNNRRPERWRDAKTVKTELTGAGGGPIMLVQANVIALREVLSAPETRSAALGMVRSIDVASRAALPSGEDGDPFAFSGRVGSEYRPPDGRAEASPLSE